MPAFNPYVPSDAIPPEYFAGRKDILRRSSEIVGSAHRGIHGGILLSGHRGIGKTSVLRALESKLAEDVAVVRIRFSRKQTLADFASEVAGNIRAQTTDWKGRFGLGQIEVPFFTVRLEPRSPEDRTPQVALLETLQRLRKIPVLWLSLDDLDYVQGDALSLMKSAMEAARRPTVVLAVAGGPELRQRLVSEHSPIVRFFSGADFDLGNFTAAETREALELPVTTNTLPVRWSEEAVQEVHHWTAGYPYLVQCLAYTAFHEGSITREDVRGAVDRALSFAGTWMEHEISHASDLDVRLFDKIATAGRNEFRSGELAALGISPVYIGRLVKLGVLRKVARGHYSVAKPPMIARYHIWRRKLGS